MISGSVTGDDPASARARLAIGDHAHPVSRTAGFVLLDPERVPGPAGRWAAQRHRIGELTKREYEVFLLLGQGLDNHEISLSLGVGERTVKLHVTSILRKLDLKSRLPARTPPPRLRTAPGSASQPPHRAGHPSPPYPPR
jgi:DNA-binding NarL/FixJ family response regulator